MAVLRLASAYAMHLMGGDRRRHSLLCFDEAWWLLESSLGLRLISQLARWSRSENATCLLATQRLGDVAEQEGLIGAFLVFGLESEREARQALRLMQLDDDPALVERLLAFRRGRCLMRDYRGRVAAVKIDPLDDQLLAALDTRPTAAGAC
jgi:hypothetical protein